MIMEENFQEAAKVMIIRLAMNEQQFEMKFKILLICAFEL